jgi:hypothetical protein
MIYGLIREVAFGREGLIVQKIHILHRSTVKPVYKDHYKEPENVAFISSCPLNTGLNYMHF